MTDLVLRYGPEPDHRVDVRVPPGDGPHPVLVVLHGGYWRVRHDRAYLDPFCADLTARGYLTCNVEYRRVGQPGGGWPGTADDVRAAVAALPELLTDVLPGLADPRRTALVGHSAGGHLALLAGHAGLSGVLALAGVCDLAATARDRLDDGAAQEFLGGEPDQLPDAYAAADPMRRGPSPTTVSLVHGDADDRVPIAFSVRYAEATGAKLHTVSGADHFDIVHPDSPAWPTVLAGVADVAGQPGAAPDSASEACSAL